MDGVTTDELCYLRKKKYPVINEKDRMEIVRSIRFVDKVVPQTTMDKAQAVRDFGVGVVFVGSDWKGTESWNQYELEFAELGCTVVYLDHTDGISSSIIRDKLNK